MEDIQSLIEKIRVDLQDGKSDEEIFQSLQPLLGKDPEFDGPLADHLAKIPHVKAAKVLQRMLKVSKEKKVRKTIKRSLYRLRGKGVVVEEEVQPVEEESILRPLQTESPKGFGNGYDTLWDRFLLLVVPHAGRGWRLLLGLVNDTKGLIHFSGEDISRREFRDYYEEVQKSSPTPLVDMKASYVGFLFRQAYQLNLETEGSVPQDYIRFKNEIDGIKEEYARPLIYSYLDAGEIGEDERVLERGGDLLKVDLFYSWRIEADDIRPYADDVREAEESKIVLHQSQKEARFQGIYQKALSELFSGERRFVYKRRLEETAYLLFKLGKKEEARLSLAVALDLEKPLNLIQPNPFLFQLVVKSIFLLLAEADEKRAKEPSLIVKP
jgi:hypothetical protein